MPERSTNRAAPDGDNEQEANRFVMTDRRPLRVPRPIGSKPALTAVRGWPGRRVGDQLDDPFRCELLGPHLGPSTSMEDDSTRHKSDRSQIDPPHEALFAKRRFTISADVGDSIPAPVEGRHETVLDLQRKK